MKRLTILVLVLAAATMLGAAHAAQAPAGDTGAKNQAERIRKVLVAHAPAGPAQGEKSLAADTFERLYGAEFAKVRAGHDPAGCLALTARLLDAAKAPETDAELVGVLCEKAYDLVAKDPRGFEIAIEAMHLVADKVGAQRVAALEKIVALRLKQLDMAKGNARNQATDLLLDAFAAAAGAKCKAGDFAGATALYRKAIGYAVTPAAKEAFNTQIDGVATHQKMQRKVDALRAKIGAMPGDAASRAELVRLMVVEFDNPAEAAKCVAEGLDAPLPKYVAAAAKGLDAAPELACIELGDWYAGLAEQASRAAKPAMLEHAVAYYQRFLDLHASADASRARVTQALNKAQDALALDKYNRNPGAGGGTGWVDVLRLVDLAKDVKSHRADEPVSWTPQGGGVHGKIAHLHSQVLFPLTLEGPYELRVRLSRTQRGGQVRIFLPVGPNGVTMCFYDTTANMNTVAGKTGPGFRESTTELGRQYTAEITVVPGAAEAQITVKWEGKPSIAWKGSASDLLPSSDCCVGRSAFGIGLDSAEATFHSVELRMLAGGQARFSHTPPKPDPSKKRPG